MNPYQKIFVYCILALMLGSVGIVRSEAKPMRWIVYYGHKISAEYLANIDLAILDPDAIQPKDLAPVPTRLIGYVSVGEAEESREYWPQAVEKDFLVEQNPDWPGAHRVDVRSPAWQALLMQRIQHLIDVGYQGVFLDTIDTAAYLEEKDSKYAGAKQAVVALVQAIHKKYPQFMIIPNNGLEFLMDYGAAIDGVVVEDLYTRYDFKRKRTIPTPLEESLAKEKLLDPFRQKYHKPVWTILYEKNRQAPVIKQAMARAKVKGYQWYVTTVDLNHLGLVQTP